MRRALRQLETQWAIVNGVVANTALQQVADAEAGHPGVIAAMAGSSADTLLERNADVYPDDWMPSAAAHVPSLVPTMQFGVGVGVRAGRGGRSRSPSGTRWVSAPEAAGTATVSYRDGNYPGRAPGAAAVHVTGASALSAVMRGRSRSRSKSPGMTAATRTVIDIVPQVRDYTALVSDGSSAGGVVAGGMDAGTRTRLHQKGGLLANRPVLYRTVKSSGYGQDGKQGVVLPQAVNDAAVPTGPLKPALGLGWPAPGAAPSATLDAIGLMPSIREPQPRPHPPSGDVGHASTDPRGVTSGGVDDDAAAAAYAPHAAGPSASALAPSGGGGFSDAALRERADAAARRLMGAGGAASATGAAGGSPSVADRAGGAASSGGGSGSGMGSPAMRVSTDSGRSSGSASSGSMREQLHALRERIRSLNSRVGSVAAVGAGSA